MVVDTSVTAPEPLFPPQEAAVVVGRQLRRCPVIGTMGSGKTRVGIESGEVWKWSNPAVVVCGVNAAPAWIRQLVKWGRIHQDDIAIVEGTTTQRRKKWLHRDQYRFLITTPQSYVNDAEYIPKHLNTYMDEYHKWARNRTKTWAHIKSHTLHSDYVFPVTGTPMRVGPQDMFPALSMCQPKRFPSFWDFVKTWCIVIQNDFGMEIVGAKNIENYKQYIYNGYCAYMPKKETDKYLPKKVRELLPIRTSKFQRKHVDLLAKAATIELSDQSLVLVANRMSAIMRERQFLVSPKLLDPTWEYGAGIETLGERLEELDTPRPVIFTDLAGAIPIIADYIQQKFKDRRIHQLRGGMKIEMVMETVESFNKSDNDIMICSQQFAESFEFPRSQVAFVLGYNWSPDVLEQAEDRLRRAISEYQNIKIYYLQYEDTIDGQILEIVRNKYDNVQKVTPEDIRRIVTKVQL